MLMKMRGQMQKGRNQKGFTLVELMVVVVIIGILVAVAVPVYSSVTERADKSAIKANLRTIDGAIMTYQATYDVTAVTEDNVARLLQEWPKGPKGTEYGVTSTSPYRAYIKTAPNPAVTGVEVGDKLEDIE